MATTRNYSDEIDQLSKDIAAVRNDIKALTKTMNGEAGKWTDNISQKAQNLGESARNAGREGIENVSQQIEAHPLSSVLTAAGVGFVIGALLRR